MKNTKRLLSLILTLLILCPALSLTLYAKDLEPCNLCKTTGEFNCPSCNNRGEVKCDLCGGAGYSNCPGEDGKGKCDRGFYTCRSCNGDGKNRTGDGKIAEGVCGNCGGSGKTECWHCHGKAIIACNRCGGQGKQTCRNENCVKARAIGYKCPKCKGAGYLLTNFWPGENDGKQNKPRKGDKIWVNGKSKTYGGSDSSSPDNGSSGTVQTTAAQNNDKKTEEKQNHTTENTTVPVTDRTDDEKTDSPDYTAPVDRQNDFVLHFTDGDDNTEKTVSIRIEVTSMSAEEKAYYESLSDEELAEMLGKIRAMAENPQIGKTDEETDALLMKLAEANGFDSLNDARMIPISFDGHLDIGFPVTVTIRLDKGTFDGGTDIYIYHIAENGGTEYIGKAEYITYEDGSIEYITFSTKSFCTFFTSKAELIPDIADAPQPIPEQDVPNYAVIFIIAALVLVLIIIITVILVLIKKKKSK